MREAVIVSSVRTAVGKAPRGALRTTRPDDLAAVAIREAVSRAKGLDPKEIEDVIIGCAMPEAEQGMNVARIASLRAGLPVNCSAMTINRFCSSGLQSIALAAERIMSGQGEVAVAGGAESMSMVPMGGNKISPNPWLMDNYPDAYLGMGLTAENLAKKYGITREQADEFSLASHQKALAAMAAGKFKDEIVPVEVSYTVLRKRCERIGERQQAENNQGEIRHGRRAARGYFVGSAGEIEAGVSREWNRHGGKQLANERRRRSGGGDERGAGAPIGHQADGAISGLCDGRLPAGGNGRGARVYAIPKALKIAGLKLEQIDVIELNEAFATQALSVIQLVGAGSRAGECERRSDRAGASARLHRREVDRDNFAGARTAQRALRPGDDVRGRRNGRRGNL